MSLRFIDLDPTESEAELCAAFDVLLIGKPRGGASQQEVAFKLLGRKVPVVSTYARGKKEYRRLSTKSCGNAPSLLGGKSKILISHFQRHIIHRQHLLKDGGEPDATIKTLWKKKKTSRKQSPQQEHPLPSALQDFENKEKFAAWSCLVGATQSSVPAKFDLALGERVAFVLPDGSITRDARLAFVENYVLPLFHVYEGRVPGNEEAVAASQRLRQHFGSDYLIQHPMLSGFCVPQPWHFRIDPAASSIDTLSGPRFAESALPIKHLRAAMFPCLCEPVVAFLHSIGVQGDIFCSGVQ